MIIRVFLNETPSSMIILLLLPKICIPDLSDLCPTSLIDTKLDKPLSITVIMVLTILFKENIMELQPSVIAICIYGISLAVLQVF